MLREQLFAEMGTDALWSDLVRPSRSLLGPKRIMPGEPVDDPMSSEAAERNGFRIEPPQSPVAL
jgi:hypothetical protein